MLSATKNSARLHGLENGRRGLAVALERSEIRCAIPVSTCTRAILP